MLAAKHMMYIGSLKVPNSISGS